MGFAWGLGLRLRLKVPEPTVWGLEALSVSTSCHAISRLSTVGPSEPSFEA